MNDKIKSFGVIPVVVLENAEDAKPLAEALVKGGLPVAEVTFRTAAAKESIRIMSENYPEMLVGAGTVLSVSQVDEAMEAGAKFIVTPGFDEEVVDYCLSKDIPVFPGVITPTEVTMAVKKGLKVVKFFPASQFGGLKTIKALSAPFGMVKFMPTGGIDASNLSEYLSSDKIVACGGSWMVKGDLIKAHEFDKIRELTAEAVELVKEIRG